MLVSARGITLDYNDVTVNVNDTLATNNQHALENTDVLVNENDLSAKMVCYLVTLAWQ